jgi:hypothetical protein
MLIISSIRKKMIVFQKILQIKNKLIKIVEKVLMIATQEVVLVKGWIVPNYNSRKCLSKIKLTKCHKVY